jgi:hypothetical protein
MFLQEFTTSTNKKIDSLNKLLSEQYSISVGVVTKKQLEKLRETANNALVQLRGSNKKFQLNPDYAKFLGIRDITETMLNEGVYAESPAYDSMCNEIAERVRHYMDEGCSMDEACGMCMRDCRKDTRFNWPDTVLLPLVTKAAESYMEACSEGVVGTLAGGSVGSALGGKAGAALGGSLGGPVGAAVGGVAGSALGAVAGGTVGDKLTGESVEEQIQSALDEGDVEGARTLMAQLKEKKAKPDYIDIDGDGDKEESMKKAAKDKAKKNESMFDDLIADILNEEVDVEQAEVVMAVRALADDIQDHVERIGRMMNEDVPAIADQMRSEMGAAQAQQWTESTNSALNSYLESAKSTKASMDSGVGSLTGEAPAELGGEVPDAGLGGEIPAEPDLGITDLDQAEPDLEEPLGRAEV